MSYITYTGTHKSFREGFYKVKKFKLKGDMMMKINNPKENLSKLTNNVISLDFDEIIDYKFPLDTDFGLEINYNGILYHFVIKFSSKNKNLICFGPGAHPRNLIQKDGSVIKPPFFDRWSWYKYFDESCIAYSDPMFLYDDMLKLGWFVGDEKEWYLENLAKIIKELARNQKIMHENILFFGSSGGGYSSICLGTLIYGSKILINNSQFCLMNMGLIKDLFRVLKKDFKGLSETEIKNQILYRLDVIELFKKENYVPPISYYLNIESKADVETQAKPFVEKIINLNSFDKLDVHFYREVKEDPHKPMNTEDTIAIIKLFCKNNLYNGDISKLEYNVNSQKLYAKLAKYNLARIDIKNKGDIDNNLDMLNISDLKSVITKPDWFKNDEGQGILIESQKNKLNFELKCIGDGDLNIVLRASDVRNNGKQIPIYINYTNLIINDKIVFNENKVVWHNKPYVYQMKVKNDECLKITIEWTPF